MLGGVLPEEARQAYFNTLAANRLVPGEPAEVYDPESQQWLPAKVAALKSSTSDAAWMSFLEKNVVRVEVRKDSGETKMWVAYCGDPSF